MESGHTSPPEQPGTLAPVEALSPAPGESDCPICSMAAHPPAYVYALGQIEARFPRLSIEKEFAQAAGRADTAGKTDQQVFFDVLSQRETRYLARQLCWVLIVQGLETYLLQPRDPADYPLLIEAIRPRPSPMDIDVVIGIKGPIASPEMCNGLMVPIVAFDQIYSFDRDALIGAIVRPPNIEEPRFTAAAEGVFERIRMITDNAGSTDEHRALNYLAMRYAAIYGKVAEEFTQDFSLSSVSARPSPLSGTRNIIDVIFAFTNRNTDFTEKFAVKVDVTDEFPFLVAKLTPFYDLSL